MQLTMAAACSALAGCGASEEAPFRPSDDLTIAPIDHAGPPVIPCAAVEVTTLDLNDATVFGESSADMLGTVLPGTTRIPFFWVGYDDLDAPVSHSPGAGETQLVLTIWPREAAVVTQHTVAEPADGEAACEESRVEIPVHAAVETDDGFLSEQFDATRRERTRASHGRRAGSSSSLAPTASTRSTQTCPSPSASPRLRPRR